MQIEVPKGWKLRPIRTMLAESRLNGSNGKEARKLTVKLYGRGVLAKDEKTLGSKATRYFVRRRGQFIYSRLDFLNGAFGIVPDELDGRESTADLPAFDFVGEVEPNWFLEFVSRPSFYEKSGLGAIGSRKAKRVSPDEFLRIEVATPPIPEQRKIAEILGSVDEAIRATEAVIEQTRKVKEGLLRELLTKGIGHTKFKQTEIGEIPVGWEVVPLEDMGLNSRDVLKTGPFGSSLKGEHFTSEGHPVLNIQCLGDGELQDGHFFVSSDTAEELRGYAVEKGDLVFSRVADVGRSVVIPESAAGWIISSNLMRIRLDKARFVSEFVMYQITHGLAVAHQLGGSVNDAGRQIVNGKTMRKLLFPMPPIAEQERLVGVSVGLDEEMRRSRAVQDGLAALKQGLLQDLLTGKVRVKV